MDDLRDFKPKLHNDLSIEDELIYNQHTNLIKNKNYSGAATLLSNNKQIDGCTTSLLNLWEQKIQQLEIIALQKSFYDPYFYSDSEPDSDDMLNKVIWQKRIRRKDKNNK